MYKLIKKMRLKIIFSILTILFADAVRAQESFTIDLAIETALMKNYHILVEKNYYSLAQINNSPGNAGMLPTIGLKGSVAYSINNEQSKFANGEEVTYNGLSTTAINSGLELNWTLFDGGRMFVQANKLGVAEEQGLLQYNQTVLQTVFDVVSAYYNVSKQKQQLKALEEVLTLNFERLRIAQTGFEAGTIAKTDFLQAKIDYNVTKESILNQENIIKQAHRNLAVLLTFNPDTLLMVDDSIPLNFVPDKEKLQVQLDSLNSDILFSKKQLLLSELSVKQNQLAYLPSLSLRAGYYVGLINNSDGSMLENFSTGPQVLATLSIPIYSAGDNSRNISGAKLMKANAEFQVQQTILAQKNALQNALSEFDNYTQLLALEEENVQLSRENFQISIERLKQGQTNSIEVHAAQEAFMQSITRMLNFRYGLKLAEIKLKQLVAQY